MPSLQRTIFYWVWLRAAGGISINAGAYSDLVGDQVSRPIMNSAEALIPAAVAVSSIHKLMEHRESSGSLVIELIVKGGGTVLVVEAIKAMLSMQ